MATKDAQGTVGTVRWSVTDGGDTLLIEPVRGRVGRVSAHDARWDGWQRPAMRVRRIRCEGTIRVTGDLDRMFCGYERLEDVSGLGHWDVSGVVGLCEAFLDCRSLASLHGLEGWDVRRLREASGAFRGCSRLETLDLSGWDAEGLYGKCGGIFDWCLSLSDIRLGPRAGRTLPYQAKRFARWREDWDGWYHANLSSVVTTLDERVPVV